MRLGILGGTFDPPHLGHLLAASDAFERLSLDRLVFVPAAIQPLKAGLLTATAAHRLAMVRLMAVDDSRFEVDPVELDREGLSYTVDTLRGFAERFPMADRYFLVGADVLSSFAQWREPREVLALARLAVLTRRDDSDSAAATERTASSGSERAKPNARRTSLDEELARRAILLPTRRVDVSSTEIRERVRCGKSIRGFVSDAVAEYISSHGLYR